MDSLIEYPNSKGGEKKKALPLRYLIICNVYANIQNLMRSLLFTFKHHISNS